MYTAHTWSASTHLRNRTKTAFQISSSILITRKEVAAQSVPKMNRDFRSEAWNVTEGQVIDFKGEKARVVFKSRMQFRFATHNFVPNGEESGTIISMVFARTNSIRGHSDMETTLAVHTHTVPNTQRRAVARVAGVLFSDVLNSASMQKLSEHVN